MFKLIYFNWKDFMHAIFFAHCVKNMLMKFQWSQFRWTITDGPLILKCWNILEYCLSVFLVYSFKFCFKDENALIHDLNTILLQIFIKHIYLSTSHQHEPLQMVGIYLLNSIKFALNFWQLPSINSQLDSYEFMKIEIVFECNLSESLSQRSQSFHAHWVASYIFQQVCQIFSFINFYYAKLVLWMSVPH